jgi:hypothetical protein
MQPTTERPFCLADYEPFLRSLNDSGVDGVLIGGLAVGGWAESLLDPAERVLFDLPIYSKDIDLRGQKAACMFLAKDMELAGADAQRLLMLIESCLAGENPLRIPLEPAALDPLVAALRGHLRAI